MDIIRAEGVHYNYYNKFPALIDVSLGISKGEKFAIIGSNGSGKSTLLQILSGLLFPSQGRIFFHNQELSEKSLREKDFLRFFREKVGFVFQDSDIQLFCPTVLDELLFGPLQLGLEKEAALERANEIMQMLKIETLKDRPSYMLSGGEKRGWQSALS